MAIIMYICFAKLPSRYTDSPLLKMNCIIYIDTDKEISTFEGNFPLYFGNSHTTDNIFNNSSLSGSTFGTLYFYGCTNQAVNVLVAKESPHKLRFFIESVARRDNLDQLTSGVRGILSQTKAFAKKYNVELSNINATIWAEGEEMIKGEIPIYWSHFRSFFPDIATSIYLSLLIAFYSFFKPQGAGVSSGTHTGITESFINLGLIIGAIVIWLFIKTGYKKRELTFKIK